MTLTPGGDRSVTAMVNTLRQSQSHKQRRIGMLGTAARVVVGVGLLAWVVTGELNGSGLSPVAWPLGLAGFPAVAAVGQWWRTHSHPARLDAGLAGYVINGVLLLGLFLPQWFVPGAWILWDAGLIFVGVSALLAAARGYAGCEILAISNWLLRRDDQVGCVLFSPTDHFDHRRTGRR